MYVVLLLLLLVLLLFDSITSISFGDFFGEGCRMERVFLDVILKTGNKWIFMIFMSNSKLKVYEVLNAAVCAVT